MRSFKAGDVVVYEKEKHSTRPGPRARAVRPAARGEDYLYVVDKYWVVAEAHAEVLVLRTPKGKTHEVPTDDPHLRRPSLIEHIWLRFGERQRLAALRRKDRPT